VYWRAPNAGPPLTPGSTLDFTAPRTLDAYAGPGWGRPEPEGSTTRGGEARLVLPLDAGLLGNDVALTLRLHARDAATTVEVRANETLVASVPVGTEQTTVEVTVPGPVAREFTPLELSLRRARSSALGRRGAVGLRLERVEVGVAGRTG
jgi:hypothetical protein